MTSLLFFLLPFQVLTGSAQGTTYTIKYVAEKAIIHAESIDSMYQEIDRSLSLYVPSSRINLFNEQGWVLMDVHMKKVVRASLDRYHASKGAFDITSSNLSSLWGFGLKKAHRIPSSAEIRRVLHVTGSHLLRMHGDTLMSVKPGVKIDCNGIAQGYTVDVISQFLVSKGIESFMVELGGEVLVKGDHPETGYWKVGIESAEAIAGNWYPIQKTIELKDKAITSSGISRNAFAAKGKIYSHIIDPKTGRPVKNRILSVTVVAKDAITADSWDNALMVMGMKHIKRLLHQQKDLLVYIMYRDRNGEIKVYSSIKK